MNTHPILTWKPMRTGWLAGLALASCLAAAQASVNPGMPFYGYGAIVATPSSPIVGENTHIQVTVANTGDTDAHNVNVQVSFNDWGVTFQGWQPIGTVVIPTIVAGGSATAEFDHVFVTRAHTCLEALILGADQNDDPNDDRGQINLEVINTGETFSYGVPVRNDGDAPLNLLVQGHCARPDGTVPGANDGACRDFEKVVEVQPGEEVLVPVVLDLRGLPPGADLVVFIDAFDLGAGGIGALPTHRNHVKLQVIRTTARKLNQDALATLTAAEGGVGHRGLRNRIRAAAHHVRLALEPRLWLDDNHVRKAGGAMVFAQGMAAIHQLLELLEADLPLTTKVQLNEVALQLTDAGRILAASAGADLRADALILHGDKGRRLGEYARALVAYLKAWGAATR